MALPAPGIISEVVTNSFHYPLRTLLVVVLLVVVPLLLKWILTDLRLEHVLPFTLNNRIKSVRNELKENLMGEAQRADYQRNYHRLLNQKTYGIKNPLMQSALMNIIHSSSDIVDVKYYRPHQYILSLDDDNRVHVDAKKVSQRRFEAALLLALSAIIMVSGLALSKILAVLGLVMMGLGLILYFAILGHFPANSRVRKALQAQFDRYYSQRGR